MVKNYNFKKFLRTIGANLKAQRTKKDLSITAVAKAVKTSGHTLRRIENGEHNMRLELLERLCLFYKVSPGDMAKEKR